MAWVTVGKQWAFIARELREFVTVQKQVISEKEAQGYEAGEYEEGWLAAYEKGLQVAEKKHRATRFRFWQSPVTSTTVLMLGLLARLEKEIEEEFPADSSYRTGMLDAINGSMVRIPAHLLELSE